MRSSTRTSGEYATPVTCCVARGRRATPTGACAGGAARRGLRTPLFISRRLGCVGHSVCVRADCARALRLSFERAWARRRVRRVSSPEGAAACDAGVGPSSFVHLCSRRARGTPMLQFVLAGGGVRMSVSAARPRPPLLCGSAPVSVCHVMRVLHLQLSFATTHALPIAEYRTAGTALPHGHVSLFFVAGHCAFSEHAILLPCP